ncbi:MAG: hypothetical protein IAE83_07510 [Anaerolinea sp.]|nr:hypothetical protein [Anaerolinea sp.]
MNSAQSASETEITQGLTQQWIDDRVLVLTFHSTNRANVKVWVEHFTQIVEKWNAERPFLYLHRAMQIGLVGLAPYMQQEGRAVMRLTQTLRGRTAIVVPRSLVSETMGLFVRSQPAGLRQRKVFSDYSAALGWVQEYQNLGG